MIRKLKLMLFFVLLFTDVYSQYTGSPNNKITLGNQTSGDGLYYRTNGVPNWTPTSRLNAWMGIDTTRGIFWHRQGNQWLLNFTHPGNIWTARSASEANSWYSVTYGNGLFVAVSYDGTNRVMTSPDGITWTARSAAQANQWYSVTYGNGLFVAVSYDGTNRVMTSPDGITWTARAAAQANFWSSVTYGNGLFVAVSLTGTNQVMTSPDGINWTARAAAESNFWSSVTYGNGLFVAVAGSGTNRVMTSPDGINWTARAAAEANQWHSVTYGNGLFVAVSYDGTNRVMTSPDGITWTARAATEANFWYSVTYGNGLFVAVAYGGTNRVMTSPDGITWTARAAAAAGWSSVTYGNGLFVAVAYSGTNRVMASGFPLETNPNNQYPLSGSGTINRVAFWDKTTNLTSDNDFVWDNTNKRLGLGTTTPSATLHINGSLSRNAPVSVTSSTHTVAETTNWLIVNNSSTCTLTLPTASSWTGRELYIKNITFNSVVSASSNVVPFISTTAGTAILYGKQSATLVSDGTNWVVMVTKITE